ncbi:hypothetical protein ABB25_07655 [Stenotrophomonas koreensis]|uniref:Heme exporter protein D n=1 Tax=Stenotrophomonas koreensis TaxID=266128 RepID=A0A0R0BM91_9GAMM|nr:heme exporter protein CcmD [Stenotrophomonas koreensis]KRG58155.1 hypothetical protein ABB25_07655 [Stenotrophomonas koreensis]
MSYLGYVIGAYAVFIVVLAADALAGALAVRRALRQGRQQAARQQQRRPASVAMDQELER